MLNAVVWIWGAKYVWLPSNLTPPPPPPFLSQAKDMHVFGFLFQIVTFSEALDSQLTIINALHVFITLNSFCKLFTITKYLTVSSVDERPFPFSSGLCGNTFLILYNNNTGKSVCSRYLVCMRLHYACDHNKIANLQAACSMFNSNVYDYNLSSVSFIKLQLYWWCWNEKQTNQKAQN